jgi:hypothetical protein
MGSSFDDDGTPVHKKEFERFHAENGVRTVIGQIGPVKGGTSSLHCTAIPQWSSHETSVRMLLREGYRHVYISRVFAAKHGFIPKDAIPGHYGYGGIVR